MTRRWLPGAAITAITAITAFGSGACSDSLTTGVIQLNLDRPVDAAFACYGPMRKTDGRTTAMASDPIIATAMPTAICDALSPPQTTKDKDGNAVPPRPFGGQDGLPLDPNAQNCGQNPCWYGFFLQSASGTVALAQWPAVPADAMFPTGLGAQQISDTGSSLFRVLDADPLTPGKNALSVGEDPVAIGTDKTGCFEITANAGSCDLSELDITSALSNIVDGNPVRPRIDRVSVTLPDGKKLLSKPSAMIVEPFRGPSVDPDVPAGPDTVGNACPAAAAGKAYIAYPSCSLVAEVQLGTGADGKATATVINGIHFDMNGTASVVTGQALTDVIATCPTECSPDPNMSPVPVTPGMRPVALDYRLDPRTFMFGLKPEVTSRLAIGADIRATPLAAPVTIVDLDLTTFDPLPDKLLPIPLEGNGGPVSVSALALSPQIGMGGALDRTSTTPGSVDDKDSNHQAQYVYAVATDGTVRVADVLNLKRECDTQIDGRFVRNIAASPNTPNPLDCLPLGQPDLPRRPGARSPGIELPGGAVASSVAIVKGLTGQPLYTPATTGATPTPMPPQPGLLIGHFAVITASTGGVYVANIDDDYAPDNVIPATGQALASSPVLVMAHQLRDNLLDREDVPRDPNSKAILPKICTSGSDGDSGASAGGPRLNAAPVQQSTTGTLFDSLDNQLPRLQQVQCSADPTVPVTALDFGAPEVQTDGMAGPAVARDTAYPDLRSVSVSVNPTSSQSLENWTLTYEGTLELDSTVPSTNGPSLHTGQTFVDSTGMFIEDASRPFCHLGVEPFDVVEFQGCDPAHVDADCPAGYTCYVHPASTIRIGTCFLKNEAPRLKDVCQDFLSSVRRYTVGTDDSGGTAPGKLVLWQRMHELSTTPVDGCQTDDQCDDLARAAVVINQSADPFTEAAAGAPVKQRPTHWSCMADPLRKPLATDATRNKRCVQTCDPAPAAPNQPHPTCASGMVCVPDATSAAGGVCMEGIEPPQVCLNGPQRYLVRAGEAFTVIGDQTGFVHPIIQSSDGKRCMRDPKLAKDPLSIGRIPLVVPACNPGADPFTGLIGSTGQFEANPCSTTVQQFESCPSGQAPLCTDGKAPPCTDGKAPTCSADPPSPHDSTCRIASQPTAAGVRMNVPAIKFRNRALTVTLVDPYRSSADSCLGHNPGDVVTNIPLVVPGYQLSFGVKAGFLPFTLPLGGLQVSPVKVVRGPTDSIWVIDDGDFVGDGITQATTRGRVFRVESVPAPAVAADPTAAPIVNTMQ